MRMIWFVLSILIAMTSSACQKDDEKDEGRKGKTQGQDQAGDGKPASGGSGALVAPKGFLTAQDLVAPANIEPLSKEKMRQELNDESSLINIDDATSEDDTCFTSKYKMHPLSATKSELKFEYEFDFADCPAADGVTTKSAHMKMLAVLSCSSADFSSWNGKAASVLFDKRSPIDELCTSGEGYSLINGRFSGTYEYQEQDGTTVTQTTASASGTMTKNGDGCHFTIRDGVRSIENGCVEARSSTRQSGSEVGADFLLLEYQNVKVELGKKYYASGSMATTLNNWRGTVTFPGADAVPTYIMATVADRDEGEITGNPAPMSESTDVVPAENSSGLRLQ